MLAGPKQQQYSRLRRLSEIGVAATLASLALVTLRPDLPGGYFLWPLFAGAMLLRRAACNAAEPGSDNSDWLRVPALLRSLLERADALLFPTALVVGIFFVWVRWTGRSAEDYPIATHLIRFALFGILAHLYGLEALFFRFGRLR